MTRLQPAIALDEYEDGVAGFGDWESRQARREARRERRRQRREDRRERRQDKKADRRERRAKKADRREDRQVRRQERRLDRVQRKKAKVREKLANGAPGPARRGPFRRRAEPTLQPAPAALPPADGSTEPEWVDDAWDAADDLFDDELEPGADESDEYEDEGYDEGSEEEGYDDAATEGIGAWRPFRRLADAAHRGPAPVAPKPAEAGAWGPSVRLGNKLRIQAAAGHRAAVIDLKPGLFLVAELPEAVTRSEFGIAPVLAPLMVTAARRALDEPPRERRGPLAALFRRRREEPVRYVQVQPAVQPAPAAPLALPGPVATDPAPVVVPAPNVGWADDATVAAAYGCDRCDRSGR